MVMTLLFSINSFGFLKLFYFLRNEKEEEIREISEQLEKRQKREIYARAERENIRKQLGIASVKEVEKELNDKQSKTANIPR